MGELEEHDQKADVVGDDTERGHEQGPEIESVPALEGSENKQDELERVVEGEGRADDHNDGSRVEVASVWFERAHIVKGLRRFIGVDVGTALHLRGLQLFVDREPEYFLSP